MIKRNRLDSQKLSEEVRKQKLSRLVSDFNKRDEPKKMYIDDKKMLLDTYKNYGSNIKKIIEKIIRFPFWFYTFAEKLRGKI